LDGLGSDVLVEGDGLVGVGFDGEVFDGLGEGLFGPEPSGSELPVVCDVDGDVVSVPVLSFDGLPLVPHASVVTSVEASKPRGRHRGQPELRVSGPTRLATCAPCALREIDGTELDV
jgi:hypothetical protein